MKSMIDRYLNQFPRNAEAGGAGGAGDGSAAASPGSSAPGEAGAAGAAPPAGSSAAPEAGSAGDGGGQSAEPYFPEGLADNLKGKDDRETIDRISQALKGYRERDAGKDLPDKPEGYLTAEGLDEKTFKLDDRFKPHFDAFQNDPGMKAAAEVARKHGIARPAFLEAVQASMAALSEAGVLEPMVDFKAERQKLLPESAKALPQAEQDKAIDQRMNDNYAFVDLMVTNRGLPKEAAEYAQLMLGDKAEGHQFLEWMRNSMQAGGTGPGAHGQGGSGGDTADSLRAEMAKPELTPGHPSFDKAKHAEFEARYKAFHQQKK
jgi:hypothetical protein